MQSQRWELCVMGLLVLAPTMIAAAEVPDWSDVRGIFFERCVMCHSSHGASKGLRLDTYEAALRGSDTGTVMIEGDADASELILRLRGESRPRMPFLSYPLPDDQIQIIVDWINAGMPE